jgi:hypothetical protein
MVRSMQLMSDDARSLGVELAEQGAARLQVILVTSRAWWSRQRRRRDRSRQPMSARVFGYSTASC